MNKNKITIIIIAVILVVIAIIVCSPFLNKAKSRITEEQISKSKVIKQMVKEPSSRQILQPKIEVPQRPTQIPQDKWDKIVLFYKDLLKNNVLIEFYGKVNDQFEKPVENASIEIEIYPVSSIHDLLTWKSAPPSTHTKHTNSSGEFSFKGFGESLSIKNIKKNGFITKDKTASFYSTVNKKSPMPIIIGKYNPVTYTIINKRECEPLFVQKIKSHDVSINGVPSYIDFKNRKITSALTPDSDLKISAQKGEIRLTSNYKINDWKLSLETINGGILDTKPNSNVAPQASEYANEASFNTADLKQPVSTLFDKRYFVYDSKTNRYSLISAYISMHKDYILVDMTIYTNPSGSRNLAYNYEKRLEKYPE